MMSVNPSINETAAPSVCTTILSTTATTTNHSSIPSHQRIIQPNDSTNVMIPNSERNSSSSLVSHAFANSKTTLVPLTFKDCHIESLIQLTVEMLMRLIAYNDRIPLTSMNLTRFHSRTPPSISIADYIYRIAKYTSVEKAVLLMILVYIDRLCERQKHFTISSLTVHRFLIAAISVSSKALSDIYCTNTHYAKVGGITTQELNLIELELCMMMDWNLVCHFDGIQSYYVNLVRTSVSFELLAPLPTPSLLAS